MELPPPITLPPNWNARKDFAYFEDRWNPNPSYTEVLWYKMRFHNGFFKFTLTRTLQYLYRRNAKCVQIEPSCLSVAEKIEILFELAEVAPAVQLYRQGLLDNLRNCQFAESERQRIVRAHRLAGQLDEIMRIETKDYDPSGRAYIDSWHDEERLPE